LEELQSLRDTVEAVECWHELCVPEDMKVKLLVACIREALQFSDSDRTLVLEMLVSLVRATGGASAITLRHVKRALVASVMNLSDLLLDCPRAVKHVAQLIHDLVTERVLSNDDAMFIAEMAARDEWMHEMLAVFLAAGASSSASNTLLNSSGGVFASASFSSLSSKLMV
jgi:hypothetical protein